MFNGFQSNTKTKDFLKNYSFYTCALRGFTVNNYSFFNVLVNVRFFINFT